MGFSCSVVGRPWPDTADFGCSVGDLSSQAVLRVPLWTCWGRVSTGRAESRAR